MGHYLRRTLLLHGNTAAAEVGVVWTSNLHVIVVEYWIFELGYRSNTAGLEILV